MVKILELGLMLVKNINSVKEENNVHIFIESL